MNKIKFNNYTAPALSADNLNKVQDNIEGAINGVHKKIEISAVINANTDYIIPLNYLVGTNDLVIFYCGEKLIKDVDYIEIGKEGSISNIIQFTDDLGDLNVSEIEELQNFTEILEIIVRGDYNDN